MNKFTEVAKLLRYYSLTSTTQAGSGHPTTCLSAADLMAVFIAGGHFTFDINNPNNPHNDRLIFSKGHAAPLFYALWAVVGAIPKEELMTLRLLDSRLEGHPTMKFPYTEVPTGSLGMGLGAGVGMALNAKYLDKAPHRTYVLLGDSEMAEGSVWESMQIASHYHLNNLIGIIDANRLGQRGETMLGHDLDQYEDRVRAFGWFPIVIDGHDVELIDGAFETAKKITDKPIMIIAKTFKGRGISFLEDKEGKHSVVLKKEELDKALTELGEVDTSLTVTLSKPDDTIVQNNHTEQSAVKMPVYALGDMIATREVYGQTLSQIMQENSDIVVLDAEMSNSTYANIAQKNKPDRFFEMFITEQNMVSVGTGLARRGKMPFVSTFAAFFTRAFDQFRMAGYGYANLKVVGSHAGVSIGPDGTSQMGLEDIAMMRTVFGSIVLCPADAPSASKVIQEMVNHKGFAYMRTLRAPTPVIYGSDETFPIGGCKLHRMGKEPYSHVVIGAGVSLHEALKAQKQLMQRGISILVVDLYSIKPLDTETLLRVTKEAKKVVVVEDHYEAGGIAEAVRSAIGNSGVTIQSLAVRKMPQSGKPDELLTYEEVDAGAIVRAIEGQL